MGRKEDLQQQIKSLNEAGMGDEEHAKVLKAELLQIIQRETAGAASVTETTEVIATSVSVETDNEVAFDIEVDVDAFEAGGEGFSAPEAAGLYHGKFVNIVIPSNKPEQRWFVFMTEDNRLSVQHRSAIIVSPAGAGAFKLKDILVNLGLPYTMKGNHVSGKIPKGHPCQMDYQETTVDQKTQIRLQNVWGTEKKLEQAI